MREKKFGKRCLTWALVLMMTLSLLPVSAMAEDGEARFYAKNFDYPEKPLKYKHIRRISD